jgi:hypothetical protein
MHVGRQRTEAPAKRLAKGAHAEREGVLDRLTVQGEPTDAEAVIDELCAAAEVELQLFDRPYVAEIYRGKLSRGGEVLGQFVHGDRKALTFEHTAGKMILHYPEGPVTKFDVIPYQGHYGFNVARNGQPFSYHLSLSRRSSQST